MGYTSFSDLSCGAKTAKYSLFIFNLIFWVIGAVMLGVGIWVTVNPDIIKYVKVVTVEHGDGLIRAAGIMVIVVGAFIFLIGFLGCCGAITENVFLLTVYSISLMVLVFIQFLAGILAAAFRNKILSGLRDGMMRTVQKRYKGENKDALDNAWDFMQVNMKCCGVDSPADWQNSTYQLTNSQNYSVPLTCCVLKSLNYQKPDPVNTTKCQLAGSGDTSNNNFINTKGCFSEMKSFVSRYGGVIIGVAFGFLVIEVAGIIIACCLRTAIRKKKEYV